MAGLRRDARQTGRRETPPSPRLRPHRFLRFRLEAQTAGRLSHPNVVGVLDFGEYEGRLFLVMELVDGGSLDGLLAASGPLPVERVARIASQAAVGLAVAHRQGIVHRDINRPTFCWAPTTP